MILGILSRSDFENINIIDGNMVVGRTKADLGVVIAYWGTESMVKGT